MANFQASPCYSPRFVAALTYAADIHSHQIRKQGNIPYLCHLLQVAGLVMEAGGNEDEAIAALLHDAIEDAGVSSDDLWRDWGHEVSYLVSNQSEKKDLPRDERKDTYVWYIYESNASVKLISCADKLHNLRSYATDGRHLWKPDTAAFYGELMPLYEGCDRIPRHWLEEMRQLLGRLEGQEWRVVLFRDSAHSESALSAIEKINE